MNISLNKGKKSESKKQVSVFSVLEEVLRTHPAVTDAAVVPRPDERLGEVPKAFIVPRRSATPRELIAWVVDHVAPYPRIRRVEFVELLPKRGMIADRERTATTTDSILESGSGSVMGRDLVLRDGSTLRLHTPTPYDYEDIRCFYDELSQESLYSRFHGFVRTDFPAALDAEADGDDRVALAVWQGDRVVACGSYDRLPEPGVAEIAFTVADDLQGRGIATQLLEQLTEIAAERGIDRFVAEVEASNTAMRRVFERAGFSVRRAGLGDLLVSPDIHPTEIALEQVEEDEGRGLTASLRSVLAPAPAAAVA